MNSSLFDDLKIISLDTKNLNKTADTLSQTVKILNEYLQNLNVGLTCYYTDRYFESSSDYITDKAVQCRFYLGYDRDQNGKWGICVLCKENIVNEEAVPGSVMEKKPDFLNRINRTRWIHAFETCPRNIRLSLAMYLPQVVSGLAKVVRNMATQLHDSLELISNIELQLKEVTA